MLSWHPNPSDPEVFHITHLDNLPSITAHGLHCDARVAGGTVAAVTIGDPTIKARRLRWQLRVPGRPVVGAFVPFYFCPRSIMLYSIHRGHPGWPGGQDAVAHLVTRVSRLRATSQRLAFTNANAASSYAYASEDLAELATKIDWAVMPLTQWSGAPFGPRQAEFLVADSVPWSAFERIVVIDPVAARRARAALAGAPTPIVEIDPTWYYP